MNAPFRTSRRDLLKTGGALVVAFSIAPRINSALAQDATAAAAKPVTLDQVESFLAIDAKGGVTLYAGKVDLGTGVRTALLQIVAEELDVPFATVTAIEGDTALTPDQGATYGSQSIQTGGVQIRQAAATARNALLDQAAQRLNVDKSELSVSDGKISAKSGGAGVTYAELIGGKTFELKVDKDAPMKAPADYKIVGKSIARVDIPDKLTGRFTYMHDFRVPGMLHGSVVRPPAIGATLESVDEGSIKDISGVVKVVRDGNFSAWSPITSGRQCARRARSKRHGRSRKRCPTRRSCGSMYAARRSSRMMSPATLATSPWRWRVRGQPLRRPMISPFTPTVRLARPAPSQNSRTAS